MMILEEAKKLAFLISQIDEGNHILMAHACVYASRFFPLWNFEVVKSDRYEWTYQVKLSQVADGVVLWHTTSEEIEKELDDKTKYGEIKNNSVPDR